MESKMSLDAMKQALDALKRSDYLEWQSNIPIIKALRERLAQPEQTIECMCGLCKLEPKTAIGTLLSD